jgi:hypothetical protein
MWKMELTQSKIMAPQKQEFVMIVQKPVIMLVPKVLSARTMEVPTMVFADYPALQIMEFAQAGKHVTWNLNFVLKMTVTLGKIVTLWFARIDFAHSAYQDGLKILSQNAQSLPSTNSNTIATTIRILLILSSTLSPKAPNSEPATQSLQ